MAWIGLVCDHKHDVAGSQQGDGGADDSLDVDRLREELVDFVVGGEAGLAPADPPALPARPDSHSAKTARARYRLSAPGRPSAALRRLLHSRYRLSASGRWGYRAGGCDGGPGVEGAASLGPGSRRQPRACASWVAGKARGDAEELEAAFFHVSPAEPDAVVL